MPELRCGIARVGTSGVTRRRCCAGKRDDLDAESNEEQSDERGAAGRVGSRRRLGVGAELRLDDRSVEQAQDRRLLRRARVVLAQRSAHE
jgi:hypothetical protein